MTFQPVLCPVENSFVWLAQQCTPHSTLSTPHSTLYALHSLTPHPHSSLYTPHSSLHTLHSTLPTLHSTLHTLHSILHTLHSTLRAVHFTLQTGNRGNMYIQDCSNKLLQKIVLSDCIYINIRVSIRVRGLHLVLLPTHFQPLRCTHAVRSRPRSSPHPFPVRNRPRSEARSPHRFPVHSRPRGQAR